MSGKKLSRGKQAVYFAMLVSMCIMCVQLVSCAAGSQSTSEISSGPAPAEAKTSLTAKGVNTIDVTNYYKRAQQEDPRAGGGMAIFTTESFVGSSRCAVCHEKLTDSQGNDMSISGHWRSTMMANASKDPFWLAKVSSEVKRNPALKEVIEKKCANCHMPMAWVEAYEKGQDQLVLEQGFLSPKNELHAAAMDGVSCSLCHQIRDQNLGSKESFSGKFAIDAGKKAPEREIFGPYKDPVVNPMQVSVGYTPVYGSHTNDSALCATCHTLFTPFVDAAGNVVGEFPEQVPYLEWKHSEFGVNFERRYDIDANPGQGMICQECHMPHSEAGGVTIARWAPKNTEKKDHFSQHHFVGGNVFMLDVLQDNITSLGLAASTEKFEDTKERTMHQLQHETAQLALTELKHRGSELTAMLQVNNIAGHKFPTGIPTRRTWIHFTVTDGAGQVIFESGKPLADGRIAGNDGDDNIMAYEEHYDMITRPDQVQIYEGVMLNTDNEVTYTLLRAASFAKDNRLLPRGFYKSAVPAEIAVYGKAVTDENFIGGSDQVTYRVSTSGHKGPFTVTARLLFTAVSYPFVKDLEKDGELFEVNRFVHLYNYADKLPQEVTAIQATLR